MLVRLAQRKSVCSLPAFALVSAACGATERLDDSLRVDSGIRFDAGQSETAPDDEATVDDGTDEDAPGGSDAGPAMTVTDASDLEPNSEDAASTNCDASPPRRPSILSPEGNARDLARSELAVSASALEDDDGHELVAAEFEIRAVTLDIDPPLVWSGRSASTAMALAEGTFAGDVTALEFDRQYSLSVRFEDNGECNNLSEWSLPVLFTTADGSEELFDPSVVRVVEITIPTDNGSPSSWDSISEEAQADGCEVIPREYYVGSVTLDGTVFDGVGVRTKGGCGSSRTLDEKPSFKLKLDWDADANDDSCPEARRWLGRSTLTLNGGVQDSSAMREHLTYRYYREAGVPAPRTASVQVYVNGEYYGLYQNIETIDRRFLRRWFDTSAGKGAMYEGAYWCDFFSGEDAAFEDGHCWQREFELDTCDDAPDPTDDLQFFESDGTTPQDPWRFLAGLHGSLEQIADPELYYPGVRELIDWDAFLTYWATGAVVVDWDNYVYWQNNFRVYRDVGSATWHFLPWGVDQTWTEGGRNGEFSPLNVRGDVARLCLESSGTVDGNSCTDDAVARLESALGQFENSDWQPAIDEWQALLDPYMQLEDDRKEYDYEGWLRSVDELRDFVESRPTSLREELADWGVEIE